MVHHLLDALRVPREPDCLIVLGGEPTVPATVTIPSVVDTSIVRARTLSSNAIFDLILVVSSASDRKSATLFAAFPACASSWPMRSRACSC